MHQQLDQQDKQKRIDFAEKMLENSSSSHWIQIWFSDESHVYLHGQVNKQNHRIWGSENPHEYSERPLHVPYVTVWAAISAHGIIGPVLIEGQ